MIPRIAIRALKIPWRRGARLALAGFAPGYRAQVLHDPRRSVPSDGVVIRLRAAERPEDVWNPDLLRLAYPFEPGSALAESSRAAPNAPLREAFRSAYAAIPDSGVAARAAPGASGAPDEAARLAQARKMLLNP